MPDPKVTKGYQRIPKIPKGYQRFPKDTKEVFGILWKPLVSFGPVFTRAGAPFWAVRRRGFPPLVRARGAHVAAAARGPAQEPFPGAFDAGQVFFSNRRNGSPPRGGDRFWQARRPISEQAHRMSLRRLVGA